MPGSRLNAWMRRATGSMRTPAMVEVSSAAEQAAEAAAEGREGAHLLLGDAARGLERVVHRGGHEVLEHLDVGRVHRSRIDRHRDELLLARHHRLDDATTGRP